MAVEGGERRKGGRIGEGTGEKGEEDETEEGQGTRKVRGWRKKGRQARQGGGVGEGGNR